MDAELLEVRASLRRGLDFVVRPDDGDEAFERHQLLAIRFHRAARLNIPGAGDKNAWTIYFGEYLSEIRAHSKLLFEKWRCALLKDEYPGSGIALSHGAQHPQGETDRGYCVNLETMRDHFLTSVDRFVTRLDDEEEKRTRTLEAFRARQWVVVNVAPLGHQVGEWPRLSTFPVSATPGPATINPDIAGSPQRNWP